MSFDDLDAAKAYPFPLAAFDGEPRGVSSSAPRGCASPLAFHESGHVLVSRFYGLPIKSVTIVPTAFYGGRVLGLDADQDASPAEQIAATARLCQQARALLAGPGEDLADGSIWAMHAACRTIELMAGHAGERLFDERAPPLDWATDLALARLYASTICAPAAIAAYLHFAAQEARAILSRYRPCLDALAAALEASGTLDGAEIDRIIATAIDEVAMRQEKARRAQRRETVERAALFLKEIENA